MFFLLSETTIYCIENLNTMKDVKYFQKVQSWSKKKSITMMVHKETIKFYSWKRDSQQSTSPKITTHIHGGKKAIYFAHCLAKRYTPSFTKRGTQEKRHSSHLIISKIWQNHPFNFQGPTKWSLLNHPLPRNCINTWLLYVANPSKGLTSLPQWPYFSTGFGCTIILRNC